MVFQNIGVVVYQVVGLCLVCFVFDICFLYWIEGKVGGQVVELWQWFIQLYLQGVGVDGGDFQGFWCGFVVNNVLCVSDFCQCCESGEW